MIMKILNNKISMFFVLTFMATQDQTLQASNQIPKVSRKFEKSLKLANQGDAIAQYKLGCRYYLGKGIDQDLATASEWYQKSAEQGCADAQYALGFMYEYGEGVDKNLLKAGIWYSKAILQGHIQARKDLDKLLEVDIFYGKKQFSQKEDEIESIFK
ncbi:MAG: tetratricopeptide repeat protein [Janthinobacterium lividum]